MSARPRAPLASLLRDESGLSLIEILIAMIVLVIGVLGMVSGFDTTRKLDLLSERRTSMAHRAQLEIERLQALSTSQPTYKELAMLESSLPTHSTVSTNPDNYVSEAGTEYAYKETSAKLIYAKLVTSTTGKIYGSPTGRTCSSTNYGACEWTDGNVSGSVYDFVTADLEKSCEAKPAECPRRITVVVTANAKTGYSPTSVRVSTLIAEPIP
jgi:Tfp pilus assembly protein PilV